MTPLEALETNFVEVLELPADAVEFLLDLWNLIQVLDDVADGDAINRPDLDRAIWTALAGIPCNTFYAQFQNWLVPAISQATLKWMASDLAERTGKADERSYNWRAGYYDVVCLVVSLVHGPSSERSLAALSLYGETYQEYIEEFTDA